MKKLDKTKKYLTPFQGFEILAVIAFTIYFALIDKENPWWYILLSSVTAICGIFCVVLCAAGKKSQYYWGFVNIITYIIVSWISRFYGEVMLNAIYFLPTQFIGLYYWKKNYSVEKDAVKCKKMKLKYITVLFSVCAGSIFLYKIFLDKLGGNSTWLDSTSTVFSVIANLLMVLRFREQWVLWIIVDIVTVIMWAITGDWIMTTMWAVYLLNACYGFIIWNKMNRLDNVDNV